MTLDRCLLRSEVESQPHLCWGGGEMGHIISLLASSDSLETQMKLHKWKKKMLEALKSRLQFSESLFALFVSDSVNIYVQIQR